MRKTLFTIAASGALLAMASTPVVAAPDCWSAGLVQAARLRQLDVMLMVGSLRCRSGAQDYRAAYDRFLLRHRPLLPRRAERVNPLAEKQARRSQSHGTD